MLGHVLKDTIAEGKPVRETCLYGTCGAQISCTDGHYAYVLAPAIKTNEPLYNYTLMPTHMREMFPPKELQELELSEPFSFTKGCRLLKIKNVEKESIRMIWGSILIKRCFLIWRRIRRSQNLYLIRKWRSISGRKWCGL